MTILLLPFTWLFALITNVRRYFYESGLFKSNKLSKLVISVGNLTVGGTGKTPFVDVLLTQFESKNLKVGVLSRGYGRSSSEILEVKLDSKTSDVGDEPLWLKKRHPQSQIIVGANRVKASEKLSEVNVIILEDGFQHFQIERDFDIVLVDTTLSKKRQALLPAGRSRESWKSISRADSVILTKTNFTLEDRVDELADMVFNEGVLDVLESQTVFKNCMHLMTGEPMVISDKKVFLCSAIATPENFEKTVKSTGAQILKHSALKDHAGIGAKEISNILNEAKKVKADLILITEKDAVKWKEASPASLDLPIGVVSTEMIFSPPLPEYYDLAIHNNR
jgi:tetraacyldisaccharide 4'-kinase